MRVEDAKQGSSRYTGELVNKVRNGRGAMRYSNDEVYVGEWVNGRRQGKGVYYYSDGTIYDGHWEDDKANGEGMCRYPTGNIYKGSWSAGKVSGRGAMYYNDGDAYDGEWKDGRLHGKGRFYNRNGDVHQGKWYEDQILENGVSPTRSVSSERSPRSIRNELARQKLAIVQHAQFLQNELSLLAPPITLHNLDRMFNVHLASSPSPPSPQLATPKSEPPSRSPATLSQTAQSLAGEYAALFEQYTPESPISEPIYSDRVGASPEADVEPEQEQEREKEQEQVQQQETKAGLLRSSSTEISSTDSAASEVDEAADLEEQERIKDIFTRLQREYQHDHDGDVLTRAELVDLAKKDAEVSELRHTLRQRSFHSWARLLLNDSSRGEQASWGTLLQERKKQREERGLVRKPCRTPRRSVAIEIPEDEPQPKAQTTRQPPLQPDAAVNDLGGACIQASGIIYRQKSQDTERTDDDDDVQQVRRLSLPGASDTEDIEMSKRSVSESTEGETEGIEVRDGVRSVSAHQWQGRDSLSHPPSQLPQPVTKTKERLPFGSPDRAKGLEYVVSMCGQAYAPFSFHRFVYYVCALLFPYPFLSFCPWSLNTRDTERNYVVHGAAPRWIEKPPYLQASVIIVPQLVTSFVYAFYDMGGNDSVVERSDVITPLLLFALFVVMSAAYHAHVRKLPHPLETLPHIQFAMFADYCYSSSGIRSEAHIEDKWVVTWSTSSHGGRFVPHKTNSMRISVVLAVLLAMAIPIHRQYSDSTMWGDTAEQKVVAILSAVTVFLAGVGVYNLILTVMYRQLLLLSQLTALTKLAVISADSDIHEHAQYQFDLTNTGLAGLDKPSSMSELRTLLGWCVCRSFVLYGSPVMNHTSRAAVLNVGFFTLMCLSLFLLATFVYDAAVKHYPNQTDRGYTFASAFIVLTSPLLFYQLRLWQRVYRQYREQRRLLAAATVFKRMQALADIPNEVVLHEAHLIQSLSEFVASHDYKPRCLGLHVSQAPVYIGSLLFIGVSTLVYRWLHLAIDGDSDSTAPAFVANSTA